MIDTSQRGTTAELSQWQDSGGGGGVGEWRTGIEAKLSIPSVTYGEQKEERLCEKFARWLDSNGRREVGRRKVVGGVGSSDAGEQRQAQRGPLRA